jgi:hypothetical protein
MAKQGGQYVVKKGSKTKTLVDPSTQAKTADEAKTKAEAELAAQAATTDDAPVKEGESNG